MCGVDDARLRVYIVKIAKSCERAFEAHCGRRRTAHVSGVAWQGATCAVVQGSGSRKGPETNTSAYGAAILKENTCTVKVSRLLQMLAGLN